MIVTGLVFLFIGAEMIVSMNTHVLFGLLGACIAAFSVISLAHPNMPHFRGSSIIQQIDVRDSGVE